MLLLAFALAACRREAGEGSATDEASGRSRSASNKSVASGDEAERGTKSRRSKGGNAKLDEDTSAVTLSMAALDFLPKLVDSNNAFDGEIARVLEIPASSTPALSTAISETLAAAKVEQLASLQPIEFSPGVPVEIPALGDLRISELTARFETAFPDEIPVDSRFILARMFRQQLEADYGCQLRITWRSGQVSYPREFLVETITNGVSTSATHNASNQRPGSRFDFLRGPDELRHREIDPNFFGVDE